MKRLAASFHPDERNWKAVRKTGIRRNTYYVSRDGFICKRLADGRYALMTQYKTKHYGYRIVGIAGRLLRVQRIVMESFHGLRRDQVVHHIDRHISNNGIRNLAKMLNGEHVRLHLGHKVVAKRGSRIMYRANSINEMAKKLDRHPTTVLAAVRGWSKCRGLVIKRV